MSRSEPANRSRIQTSLCDASGQMRRVLAAAPSYLARCGYPEAPADLAHHDMLVYNLANDPYSLRLQRDAVWRLRFELTMLFSLHLF